MSPIERPLSGDVLIVRLDEERETTHDPAILRRSGRSARTLFKQGALRATLVVLGPDGETEEHRAPGPIMVQPLEGRIRFSVGAERHELGPGELLTAGPGVAHSVSSQEGATFLLTVVQPDSRAAPE